MSHSPNKIEQLKSAILNDIRSGIYRPGDSLPGIRALCMQYDVSKHTVSQALSNLNERKVLDVAHGKATKVRCNPFNKHIEVVYLGYDMLENQDFWIDIYSGIKKESMRHPEYTLGISAIQNDYPHRFIENFNPGSTNGFLLLGTDFEMLLPYQLPMISIHDYKENSSVPAVTANLKTPIDELFDRILAQGRRAISIFEVKDRHSEAIVPEGINAKKLSLLKEAIHKNNLQNIPDFVKLLSTSPADGYGLIMEMHQSNRMPDTIILTRDSLAIGVLRAIHELGLKIPDDVAIISFDNLAFSPFLTPSLSSVDLNRQLMGELAFRTLVEHIDCGTPLTNRSVEAKLILRESFSS